jgi:hypothetical protein
MARPAGTRSALLVGVSLAAIVTAICVVGGASAANIPAIAGTATQNNAGGNVGAVKKADEPPRQWAFDTSNGCKVWNAEPIGSDITVHWSGRCENGLAQGPGTVRWLSNNKQVAELSGTMEQGKLRGHTSGVEEPGNRFDGMYIDSLPEGQGKASFADGSTYSGQWHRGRQLGYGVMTFPPAHPQYQDLLKNGKGSRVENGIYVLRGWWEGKTFVTPCNSEEECEKAVVAMMKLDQDAAAAKAAAQTAPAIAPVAPTVATPAAIPAVIPVVTPETPTPEPVVAPGALPEIKPEVVAPAAPVMEPAVVPSSPPVSDEPAIPAAPAVEAVPPTPAAVVPDAEPAVVPANVPAVVAPAPELPAVEPALTPVAPMSATPATEPATEKENQPATAPMPTAPVTPATEPAGEPAAPVTPEADPAATPRALTPAPGSTDAAFGAGEPISISNGSS